MAVNNAAPAKSKKDLAEQLGVSRQSLYYKPKLPEKDLKLKYEIEKVMEKHKRYGHKRIADDLKINKKRILRVMKLFHLKPKRTRKPPFKPEDQNQAPMDIPNLLKETIIDAPNLAYASDFTYLPCFGKFIYLATIEDVFTREILGWEVSTKHNTDLVASAMINALRCHPAPKLAHSDQGSEYRSRAYRELLEYFGIKCSMSQKACPWQNGKQESFYSEFKLELGHSEAYPTLGELIEAIALQIHYYNHERIHTALRCPPVVFAARFTKIEKIEKIQKNLIFQDASNILSV